MNKPRPSNKFYIEPHQIWFNSDSYLRVVIEGVDYENEVLYYRYVNQDRIYTLSRDTFMQFFTFLRHEE